MKLDKFSWDWFGKARVVTINKDQTTIIDGLGNEEKIKQRIEELQSQIDKSNSPYEKEKLQERLAKFVGGVAIVHVGGFTEAEMKEKKDRVDDALQATKAALEEGIVPGGGIALLHARNCIDNTTIGGSIIYKACLSPFTKILSNAGFESEEIYGIINTLKDSKFWDGFNLKNSEYVNMEEAGIIDPSKVTRCALENAASVATVVLLTEAVVIEKENPKAENNQFIGMDNMY